jgi:hypothetical protein
MELYNTEEKCEAPLSRLVGQRGLFVLDAERKSIAWLMDDVESDINAKSTAIERPSPQEQFWRQPSCRHDLVPDLLSSRPGQDRDFLAGTHTAAWCALPTTYLTHSKIMEAKFARKESYPLRRKGQIDNACLEG